MILSDLEVIQKTFFINHANCVAPLLLGKYLVKISDTQTIIGKIVETEAYGQDDPASHSYKGITPRCAPMFKEGGISYVYFIYGMYYCFNVVTDNEGVGSAVLIRAVEPICGIERATNGPARLCKAYDIDKKDNEKSLLTSDIRIMESINKEEDFEIVATVRIGIKDAQDKPFRYYIKGNKYVSGY